MYVCTYVCMYVCMYISGPYDGQGLIQDLNLGGNMNVKKILQIERFFVFCFMFSLDKFALL